MKFFNIDFHISVVADLQHIFTNLGHQFDDWCLSGHHWVLNKKKMDIPLLNGWEKIIDKQLWNDFADTYPELEKYDAFVCTYPPVFAMLYNNFNKPIIIHIPIRYEHPFTQNRKNWEIWNQWLRDNMDSGKVIVACNSKFEKFYFESYVGREAYYIPNLCEYTNMHYCPEKQPMVYHNNSLGMHFDNRRTVGTYKWNDLAKRRSLIHYPYQVSTMSIFEQYTANIPLIFPSKEFTHNHPDMLHQVLWSKTTHQPADPPNCKVDWEKDWLDNVWLADYYQWPHIQYYDSIQHCMQIAGNMDESAVYHGMKEENFERHKYVYDTWQKIISDISNWKGVVV